MSRLRAKCPECGTYTAVALGPEYECHVCGRQYGAGLVRVPRAWGEGGGAMAEAAHLPLPFPEAAVVEEGSLQEQNLALAAELPARPLVLGGCCCSHVGAVTGLASRHGRISVVWIDAHGDLNTPESSPSGNQWGMPLRMLLDSGTVDVADVVLVGARNLDPPEEDFIARTGLRRGPDGLDAALADTEGAYVAFDCDALAPGEIESFMPEPGGLTLAHAEELLARTRDRTAVVGAGFTGAVAAEENTQRLVRLARALGLD